MAEQIEAAVRVEVLVDPATIAGIGRSNRLATVALCTFLDFGVRRVAGTRRFHALDHRWRPTKGRG